MADKTARQATKYTRMRKVNRKWTQIYADLSWSLEVPSEKEPPLFIGTPPCTSQSGPNLSPKNLRQSAFICGQVRRALAEAGPFAVKFGW